MKAVHCTKFGSHLDLQVVDVSEPALPEPNEVTVAMETRGIQFSDLVRIAGDYQIKSKLPFVVGGEGAGTIIRTGDNVTDFAVGDRVICPGGCIEQINLHTSKLTKVPANVDLQVAASFRNNYATAYDGLQRARLCAGETLLVHGAAGGVGLAAVDLGKLMGATVIAAASSEEKLEVAAKLGADHGLNYTHGFREAVKDLTNGLGADVIYDPVGGDVFDESMRCIAPFGRILVLGFTSGRAALAKTNHLLVKDASVIGYTVGGLQTHAPEKAKQNNKVLLEWLAAARISPYISHVLPMQDIAAAYQLIVDRKVMGKVMITN